MPRRTGLSRRQALAGLATIGLASAGAGIGTSALFSDSESFDGNTITAGSLDMAVTVEVVAASSYWDNTVDLAVTADGDVIEGALEITDIKPGDWGIICFIVDIEDNPGYVTIHAKNFSEAENDLAEPEEAVDDSPNEGELDEKLLVSYWEQYDDSGNRSGLSRLDNITNAASNQLYLGNWQPPDADGAINGTTPAVEYTNAREFYFGRDGDPTNKPSNNDPLGAGFASGDGILVGGTSDPVRVGATDNLGRDRLSDPDGDGESELVFYLLLEVPPTVGNVVQSDSVGFDLVFTTEQARTNDDPRSGTWDGY